MGMVLLVIPSKEGQITISLSGQFDLSHRYIPDFDFMQLRLNRDTNGIKPTQPIVTSYKRFTVTFKELLINLSLPSDDNRWISPKAPNSLTQAIDDIGGALRSDPRVFKRCKLNDKGAAVFHINWSSDIIVDQDSLNRAVVNDVFDDLNELLLYQIRIRCRARRAPLSLTDLDNAYLLEVYLENATTRNAARAFGINNPHLLDTQFLVCLIHGTHHLLPHKLASADFRYQPGNGVPGYGITTGVEQLSERTFWTNTLPTSELPRVENPLPEELGMIVRPDFEVLWKNPIVAPRELINAIGQYVKDWELQISDLLASGKNYEADESALGLQALKDEKAAIADGVFLLENNTALRTCFSWTNEVMLCAIKLQGKSFTGWRLFQLGFILTQIRAIYERCCSEKDLSDHLETAEVLWFSTGGGKTEAYLGIIVMAMLYERLSGRTYGTTAWMRFPLRMLSVQQFQRLSYVVAQANIIRQREKLGGHPFTIGYFTGTGTPKRITGINESDRNDFLPSISNERLNELKFISDCPYCPEKNSIEMIKDLNNGRIKHICNNPKCWSNIGADEGVYGEGIHGELGIYVSDEECYRYIPTVMVGTIDKLAVISHNKRFRYFFGGATHYCPQHGFSFEGRCVHNRLIKNDDGSYTADQCPNNSRTSQIRTKSLGTMPFPGISILIQDELHLLKENMGNFDSHYETLFSALQEANGGRKPKNLAATATIKEYEHHVTHLYQRKPRRFPVPGYTLNESFYSRVVKDDKGEPQMRRLYAGILPLGTGPTMAKATALVSSRYLTLIDELRSALSSDPDSACEALGFDSNRADDLIEHIETYLNANLMYVNSFQSLSDVVHALEDAQVDYPDRRYQQLSGKSTLEEIQSAIENIETKEPDDQTRQVVATSVVSHGVDMHRLNFMVIAGWPKSIAEYMQSSARAGRIEPGIVLTVLNSRVLFQSNVFMNFTDYHKFMDRMVESVPINRFAPNLIERTLPGIISAWIINWAAGQGAPWGGNIIKNAGQVKIALNNNAYKSRQQLKSKLLSSLMVPQKLNVVFDDRVVKDFIQALDRYIEIALNQLGGMPSDIADDYLSDALERLIGSRPMRSLRDIESQIIVLPQSLESGKVLEALGRRR